jgi:hypothetical protein
MARALTAEVHLGVGGPAAASWRCVPGEGYHQALHRLRAKQQVIAELINGRVPLLEATARFWAAQCPAKEQAGAPPSDDGEQLCRTVIGWAYLALSERPERADAFSEELEQELQAHLTRHGTVRLPRE